MEIITMDSVNDELINGGKNPVGRPRTDSEKKKHFTLSLTPTLISRLNKAVARKQLETGDKQTLSGLINEFIEKGLAEMELDN